MSLEVPTLIYRTNKGSALTSSEVDQNFRSLKDFANALAAKFEISLNLDGTVKDGAVSASSMLADRVVTARKLDWYANLFGVTSHAGPPDVYTLTISPTTPAAVGYGSLTETMLLVVKFNAANSGPATLNVNSLGAKPLTKRGAKPLVLGDIASGQIHLVAYDGTRFQLLTPRTLAQATRGILKLGLLNNMVEDNPAATWKTIPFDSVITDEDSTWNLGEDTLVKYRWTAPAAGWYNFTFVALLESTNYPVFRLWKNGIVAVPSTPVLSNWVTGGALRTRLFCYSNLFLFEDMDVVEPQISMPPVPGSGSPTPSTMFAGSTFLSAYKVM